MIIDKNMLTSNYNKLVSAFFPIKLWKKFPIPGASEKQGASSELRWTDEE
jgi:hypothetical protein